MERTLSYYFEGIEDPRVVGRCDHLLSDLLLVAICTYITGGSDYQDMYLFCKERGEKLKEILVLPNGFPSVDTYERLFKRLDADALKTCLDKYGREILLTLKEKQIVLDGKKLRGVSPTKTSNSGCYILNAWVSENRICIGQKKVNDKSNEIVAIPEVLNSLDIEEATVTIDAIGTQTAIAEQIRNQKGHYLLSVKENQKELLEDIECAFKVHIGYDCVEETDCGHGRIETRRCSILPAKGFLMDDYIQQWKDVATLVKIDTYREIKGKGTITEKTRYYISDETFPKASYYQGLVRAHWGIENQLHWHLDVTFDEDKCRARTGYAPENLSTIRKFALQVIAAATDKYSLKKRQYKAALDLDYMRELLGF
jgi:predicted transposase YbfD/YdcC